jgi:branched-subunit amino acid aminotransferase/4-amino-4-deoxychorismate lyase
VFFVFGETLATANDEAVLGGITRKVVQRLAEGLGVEVQRRPIHQDELVEASEAFVTATSIGILPVRRLRGRDLRLPGPVTQRLTAAFSQHVGLNIVEQARGHLREAIAPHP